MPAPGEIGHEILIPQKVNHGQPLVIDNRDDKGQFTRLLNFLPPHRRVDFLAWMCSHAKFQGSDKSPGVSSSLRRLADEARYSDEASSRLTIEIVIDTFFTAGHFRLDLQEHLKALERMVKLEGKRPTR